MTTLRKMKRIVALLLVLSLFVTQVQAVDYEPAQYNDNGFEVNVEISANTPWASPFNEEIQLHFSVVPTRNDIEQFEISQIIVPIQEKESETSFSIIAVEIIEPEPPLSGTSYINYTSTVGLSGTSPGNNCFFGLYIRGSLINSSGTFDFDSESPADLVGPFLISPSVSSPQSLIGLIIFVISGIFIVAGIQAVRKDKSESTRKKLLDE